MAYFFCTNIWRYNYFLLTLHRNLKELQDILLYSLSITTEKRAKMYIIETAPSGAAFFRICT